MTEKFCALVGRKCIGKPKTSGGCMDCTVYQSVRECDDCHKMKETRPYSIGSDPDDFVNLCGQCHYDMLVRKGE